MRGGSVAAGVDAEHPAAAELGEGVVVEHLDVAARTTAATAMATSAMRLRREVAGRRVGEVAGELGGVRQRRGRARRRASTAAARPAPATSVSSVERRCRGASFFSARVAVAGEQDALDDGLAGGLGVDAADVGERRRQAVVLGRGPGERGGRVAQRRPASSSAGSPMPTATTLGPPVRGTTSVWPTLPSKPDAASVARSSPSWRGTGPFSPTGTPSGAGGRRDAARRP